MYLNRREFIKGSIGVGTAAGLAFAGPGVVSRLTSFDNEAAMIEAASSVAADVLVVGGGITAAFAAIKAAEQGANVVMVDKGRVGHSGLTPWFHGFAVYDESQGSSKEEWTKAFMLATEYITHMDYLDLFYAESKNRWNELVEWGATSNKQNGGIGPVLRQKVLEAGVQVIERTMITDLIKKDDKVVGAIGFPLEEEKPYIVQAATVILCTGAGTFKTPGWPAAPNTFDGHMMAYRAGAELSGKEWNDFHTTNTVTPDYIYGGCGGSYGANISAEYEAASHSLNYLFYSAINGVVTEIDDETMERLSYSNQSDGAPGGGGQGGPPEGEGGSEGGQGGPPGGEASVDGADVKGGRPEGGPPADGENAEGNDGGENPGGPPQQGGEGESDNTENASGIATVEAAEELSPGTVLGSTSGQAEHRTDGIFPADEKCFSGVEGLYAAGDAMCTGGVGLAGAATPGCAVQGAMAGTTAAQYAMDSDNRFVNDDELESIVSDLFAPLYIDKGYSGDYVIQLVQTIMVPYYVLYVKEESRLKTALANIEYLRDHFVPLLIANDMHELRAAHEARNIVLNAEMKLRASLFRTESRHSHYREDIPARDDENWLAWVMIKKVDEGMELYKKTIPEEWISDYGLTYEERYSDRFPGELEYMENK